MAIPNVKRLTHFNLPVDLALRGATDRLRRREHSVTLDRNPIDLLDGPQSGSYPGLTGGDGLAVAPAVGAFGQVLAGPLDLDPGASLARNYSQDPRQPCRARTPARQEAISQIPPNTGTAPIRRVG